MKTKIFLIGILLSLILLVGCSSENEIKIECKDKTDCEFREGLIKECLNYRCIYEECFDELDCNGFSTNWRKCIENKCIDFSPECERIANIDYGYETPKCEYTVTDKCFCKDMRLVRKRQEIERDNSIEIIDEYWDFDEFVYFEIK